MGAATRSSRETSMCLRLPSVTVKPGAIHFDAPSEVRFFVSISVVSGCRVLR